MGGGEPDTEEAAKSPTKGKPWVRLHRYKGFAPSRLEERTMVGSVELLHAGGGAAGCRPDRYLSCCARGHGVVPKDAFVEAAGHRAGGLPATRGPAELPR